MEDSYGRGSVGSRPGHPSATRATSSKVGPVAD